MTESITCCSTSSSSSDDPMARETSYRASSRACSLPFSNWAASFGEELAVGTLLWLAFTHPIAALVVLGFVVLFMLWLIPKVWRFIRAQVRRVAGLTARNGDITGRGADV
jgi:hypothetical protein